MINNQKSFSLTQSKVSTPLVTFAIICFQQERYIAEAFRSALAQTHTPLEIVISDDCSTDNTYSIVEEIAAKYDGPHKLITHSNSRNLGLAGNVNKVWELSSGEFVVFQGGDDISLPHRTAALVDAWISNNPRPDLVYSGEIGINEEGKKIYENKEVVSKSPAINDTITGKNCFIAGGCVAAYARSVHFDVGPLNNDVVAEDFVYSFRALLGNGALGVPEPLVRYRHHSASIIGKTWRGNKKDDNVKKIRKLAASLAILKEYLRAMDYHKVNNKYLRWRLKRNIKMTEVLLNGCNEGLFGKLLIMVWALGSIRPRAFLTVLNDSAEMLTRKKMPPDVDS